MKEFFTDYNDMVWKGSKKWIKKHWKGYIVLVGVGYVVGCGIGCGIVYKDEIKEKVKSEINKVKGHFH